LREINMRTGIPRRFFLTAALAVSIGACGWNLVPRNAGPPPRAKAPDFVLEDEEGKKVALADLLSTGVAVVVFYRGYW
jgi:hypothetical protein